MQVKLVIIGGKNAGRELSVPGPKFFIGRAEDCQLRPQSDLVSRHHCAILVEEGFVAVRDFGSRNGTYVNGEQIKAERELKSGDRLKVGPLEFEVRLAVELGGKKKPKVHTIQEAAARTVESVKGGEDESDISEWLRNGAETTPELRSADTAPITTTVTGVPAAEKAAAAPEEEPKKQKDDESKGEKDKLAGKLPREKKPPAGSSRDAAADVLRQFFGRR
jgi:pSer/pThr/pTyr-binding forkhead associated (FHA) protein